MMNREASDVAQEIRMERQTHKGAFLILEGRNDQKTLYKHIDENSCSIVVAGSKAVAIEALEMLDNDGFAGVVCLVDKDFENLVIESENLVETDAHDMDIVVFCSAALDRYLFERADEQKLRDFERRMGRGIRDALFEAAAPVGCLRLLSKNIGLNLNFSNMRFAWVAEHDMSVDEDGMFNEVVWEGGQHNRDELRNRYEIIKRQNHPRPLLCQGHDLMTILGIALIRCIADVRNINRDMPDARTWRSEVEMGCRLAFGRDEFEGTRVYKALADWEGANRPYRILPTRFGMAEPVPITAVVVEDAVQ